MRCVIALVLVSIVSAQSQASREERRLGEMLGLIRDGRLPVRMLLRASSRAEKTLAERAQAAAPHNEQPSQLSALTAFLQSESFNMTDADVQLLISRFRQLPQSEQHVFDEAVNYEQNYHEKRLVRHKLDDSHRRQPLFSIPRKKRLAVELSVQRSGSTLLLNVFSVIDGAFMLPEPYNMFEVTRKLPRNPEGYQPPTIQALLNCSFVNNVSYKLVFWEYACNNIQWIRTDFLFRTLCKTGHLPPAVIFDKCINASINVFKIVRVPLLISHFGDKTVIPPEIKVFNLVRAPWEVFMSQMATGWFADSSMPYLAMLPKGIDVRNFNMDRICKEMLLNRQVALARPASNTFFIRYQDLVQDFELWIKKLFHFLDIPTTPEMIKVVVAVQTRKYADFFKIPEHKLTMTMNDARIMAMNTASCQEVIDHFGFTTN